MSKTMQAAFVKAPYQFELREVPIPAIKEDWALIQVKACGVCGTDVHIASYTDHQLTPFPATQWQCFGHEIAGVVVATGQGVHNVKEGDKVVLESSSYDPSANISRDGRVDLSNTAPNFWSNDTMGFAEYILAPKECLVPFDDLSFEVACLSEPLGVALDMTYASDIHLGNEVLVLGLGAIGLMAIPLVRMKGASRIYAVNRSGGNRAEIAKKFGADEVFLTDDLAVASKNFRKGGVDRALVSAPPSVLPDVMKYMNYGGIISYIGIEYGEGAKITFDANSFHFNKTQLRASHASPALYFPTALQLLQDKQVDGDALISHIMPLEKIAEAMNMMQNNRNEVLKIVITP